MKQKLIVLSALVTGLILGLTSCGPLFNRGDIEYFDDDEVFVYEEELPSGSVVPSDSRVESRGRGNRRRIDEFEYRILRVAQVQPVVVDGSTVQANDIVIDGDEAFVVYNTAGDPYAGALQVVNFQRPTRPVITTEIALPFADVSAVAVTETHIYIGGAWDPDNIPNYDPANPGKRAFVARITRDNLNRMSAQDISDLKVILDSYVTTGIALRGDTVFVSTGADGGELVILSSDLSDSEPAAFADLRDVETYHGGVVALQGTDFSGEPSARVLTIGANGSLRADLDIADFGSPNKKATIEVYNNRYAFLGLSEVGFRVYYLRDDSDVVDFIYEEPNPTGLDWTTRVDTNSASYSNDLVFTANGEAGFRVFSVSERLDKDEKVTGFLDKVGFVPFDLTDPDGDGTYWSANHVEYRQVSNRSGVSSGILAVASGVGGVNFYYLILKE